MDQCKCADDCLNAQLSQINHPEDDCVESTSDQSAWQEACLSRIMSRDNIRVSKLRRGQSPVAGEVVRLRADVEAQIEHNRELKQQHEGLQNQGRRRREPSTKDRQAVLELCKEHATSSMVATVDEDNDIHRLIVKLRQRLQRKQKMHHDRLQRARKQNNDLLCALEHSQPEDLRICQHAINRLMRSCPPLCRRS